MKKKNKKLLISQIDDRMRRFVPLGQIEPPENGWVNLFRVALNLSLSQLGKRLDLTPQGVKKIETNEAEGRITLNTLREAGNAFSMKLVYGFIPKNHSLEQMIAKQAESMARRIVMRTSTSMKLEDQENSPERIEQAIAELTEELKRELPKTLWD